MNAFLRLTELVKFCPGLSKIPIEVEWPRFERNIGIRLPDDFKQIIDFYGAGIFFNYITFALPIDYGSVNFEDLLESLKDIRSLREQSLREDWMTFEDRIAIWPEPDGLLPFAVTPSSTRLYWKTTGESNSWTICVESDAFVHTHFSLSASEYLVNLLSPVKNEALFRSFEGLSIFPDTIRRSPCFRPEKMW